MTRKSLAPKLINKKKKIQPPVRPKKVESLLYYNRRSDKIEPYHHSNGPYNVPETAQWCAQPIPDASQNSWLNYGLCLHDHRTSGASFYVWHRDSRGRIIHYTHSGAMEKAAQFNHAYGGDGFRCPSIDYPVKSILTPYLTNLHALHKDRLVELMEAMIIDFQRLNTIYNQRAREHGWCGQYEQRQLDYNGQLRVFKLVGRSERTGGYGPGL